jgi:hypothetical protein
MFALEETDTVPGLSCELCGLRERSESQGAASHMRAMATWSGARHPADRGNSVTVAKLRCRSGTAASWTVFPAHDGRQIEEVNREEERWDAIVRRQGSGRYPGIT